MTYGWELNVPRAKQMSAGLSSRNRFIRSARPHTTPIGRPPATVLPWSPCRPDAKILLDAAAGQPKA